MIKAVAVHCHGDTPNEINSNGLAQPRRLNNKLSYRDEVFTSDDPTGLSSTAGQLVILFGLLSALVVLIRWWWQQRGR
jgi:hypothetical protein